MVWYFPADHVQDDEITDDEGIGSLDVLGPAGIGSGSSWSLGVDSVNESGPQEIDSGGDRSLQDDREDATGNVIIEAAERQARGLDEYISYYNVDVTPRNQLVKSDEQILGGSDEDILEDAATKTTEKIRDMERRLGSRHFYFTILFGFANGSWKTVTYPGSIDIGGFWNADTNAYNWANVFEEIRSALNIFWARIQGNYQDDQTGGIVKYVIGVHAPPERVGGCTTKNNFNMKITYESDEGGTYTVDVMNFKSRNNNCGIICLLKFHSMYCMKDPAVREPLMPSKYCRVTKKERPLTAPALKKEMKLAKQDVLKQCHFELLSKRLSFHIVCRDKQWNMMWECNTECKRRCTLMWRDDHYLLCVKDPIPKRQKRSYKKRARRGIEACPKCLKPAYATHRCRGIKRRKAEPIAIDDKEEQGIQDMLASLHKREAMNWLIYGAAGTGKSYVIEQIQRLFRQDDTRFTTLSPTGVAATNIDGSTIHSYFCLGLMTDAPEKILKKVYMYRYDEVVAMEYIILEECSMIEPRVFCMINEICKKIRKSKEPFGGIKLILVGDFLQLAPVSKDAVRFIFEFEVWQKIQRAGLRVVNLITGHRFKGDTPWHHTLMRVRKAAAKMTQNDLQTLKRREMFTHQIENEIARRGLKPTYIYGRKIDVDKRNQEQQKRILGPAKLFPMHDKDGVLTGKQLRLAMREVGITETLSLKIGSEVMCIDNRVPNENIANGSRGTVTRFIYQSDNGSTSVEVDFEVVGKIVIHRTGLHSYPTWLYIPLILAFAITSHKAQSKTLNCVVTDLTSNKIGNKRSQIWEPSQLYVIISRVRRLKNLFIIKDTLSVDGFFVNPRAYKFSCWAEKWKEGDRGFPASNPHYYLDTMFFPEICGMNDLVSSCLKFRPKSLNPKKLLKNIIFYDYETSFDEVDKMEKPYFNHLKYYFKGELREEITQCAICDKNKDIREESYKSIMRIIVDSADRALKIKRRKDDKVGQFKEECVYLCAYNGGSFDYHFIMQKLIESPEHAARFIPHIISKGTRIVRLSLYDKLGERIVMRAHDMTNILPGTRLATAARDFAVVDEHGKAFGKDIFPHLWVTPERIASLKPSSVVNIPIECFDVRDRDEVLQSSDFDITRFHFDKVLHKYGKRDVDVLIKLYEILDGLSQDILKTSLLNFPSLSRMTWYGFLKNIPSKFMQEKVEGRKTRYAQIYRMNRLEDADITRSIQGGKVLPRITSWFSSDHNKAYEDIKDYYADLDVNSMYVEAMMTKEFPYGEHVVHDENSDRVGQLNTIYKAGYSDFIKNQNTLFIALTDCKPHPREIEPCIARRRYTKDGKQAGGLKWDCMRRIEWYTNISLNNLLKNKGKVFKIKKAYEWPHKAKLFSNWVTKTFDGRKKAKDEPAKAKFFKTLGNACYGSSCQRPFDDVIRHVSTPDELTEFHYMYDFKETVNFEEVLRKTHAMLILKGKAKVKAEFEYTERPRYLGAFVLAYTKVSYDEAYDIINPHRRAGNLLSVNSQILYGDTDSLFAPQRSLNDLMKANKIGKKPGQLSDDINEDWYREDGDHQFAKIIEYVGPAAKSYAVRAVHPPSMRQKIYDSGKHITGNVWELNGKTFEVNEVQVIQEVTKFKGINRNNMYYDFKGQRHRSLTLPIIKDILSEREKGTIVRVVMPKRITKNGLRRTVAERAWGKPIYNIERKDLKRGLFVSKFTSRQKTINPSLTVPNYYDETALTRINEEILAGGFKVEDSNDTPPIYIAKDDEKKAKMVSAL